MSGDDFLGFINARLYHARSKVQYHTSGLIADPCQSNLFAMLGSQIRHLRKKLNLTQQDLAKRAGVSQQLVTKLETGQSEETRKLPQIASALGVSVEELIAGRNSIAEPRASYHGILLTRAGAMLAAEWEKLEANDRYEIEQDIIQRVAKKVRSSRTNRPSTRD